MHPLLCHLYPPLNCQQDIFILFNSISDKLHWQILHHSANTNLQMYTTPSTKLNEQMHSIHYYQQLIACRLPTYQYSIHLNVQWSAHLNDLIVASLVQQQYPDRLLVPFTLQYHRCLWWIPCFQSNTKSHCEGLM